MPGDGVPHIFSYKTVTLESFYCHLVMIRYML